MLEPGRPPCDHPTTCAIDQQYSSVTFVKLRCHSRKVKFGAIFKNFNISIPLAFTSKFHMHILREGLCCKFGAFFKNFNNSIPLAFTSKFHKSGYA
jgi:hypothetical protein